MERDSARELKTQLLTALRSQLRALTRATTASSTSASASVAVGLRPRAKGYALAVRVSTPAELHLTAVDEVVSKWGAETEVRVVGAIRAATAVEAAKPRADRLVPGASVAHVDVTAGTLGAFVQNAAGQVFLLSNNHVLADTNRASIGDAVLSPGPADGGIGERDRVGVLAAFENLVAGANRYDVALALLDDGQAVGGNVVPEGRLTTALEEVVDGLAVAKVGRTTAHTTGLVSAVELDGVTVDYGRGDLFTFDDCLEIEGDEGAFSAGGDSGSIVYERGGGAAVGLLFAGSTAGGRGDAGLTFCNPVDVALRQVGVTLL